MTRINVIDPMLLSDAHLGAEYRELPRIYGLVRGAINRGERPFLVDYPPKYVLGPGHVRFFFPRLKWLTERFVLVVEECQRRGRKVNFSAAPLHDIPIEWFGDWQVTEEAIKLNIDRINQRGGLRVVPQFQRQQGD